MVRNFLYILIFAAWVLFLTSCEKVLDLELESVDQVWSLKELLRKTSGAIVRISKTTDYYSDGKPQFRSQCNELSTAKGFRSGMKAPGVYTCRI
jgi:hypothetical protein